MINITKEKKLQIIKNIIYNRHSQLIINEYLKLKKFKIPVHLGLGHELIAEAVAQIMLSSDHLICSHRNIHYHLAKGVKINKLIDEYFLLTSGLGKGKCGSMNLNDPKNQIIYTSNILGNNLPVSLGVSLSKKIKSEKGLTIVISGDGAIEEGAFIETIQSAVYFELPLLIIIENNQWSLASTIEERRKKIDLKKTVTSYGGSYFSLKNNIIQEYISKLSEIRDYSIKNKRVSILEVHLDTLGSYILKNKENPNGKYINYHAGISPDLQIQNLIIAKNQTDPIYQIQKEIGEQKLNLIFNTVKKLTSKYLP